MIRLSKPFIPEEAFQIVVEILKSGYLIQGQYVQEFESELSKYLGCKHVVVVSSGTAALHLSLMALGIGIGDEVIVPAFTFPATANVVEIVGAKPVFVDINLDNLCIDVKQIEKAITKNTKAIMPVHEFGYCADMNAIMEIAGKYNLRLIEDAACAFGVELNYKKAGTFGELGCFSFHPRKILTTGEGGAVVTSNDKLADHLRSLRNHGIVKESNSVDFLYAGLNYRMTEFQAAIGISQLKIYDKIIHGRLEQASLYHSLFMDVEKIELPALHKDKKHIYQTFHILLDSSINRNNIIAKMKNEGIETNLGAQAMNYLTFYKNKYSLSGDNFPNASFAYAQGLALPIGIHIGESEINSVVNSLKNNLVLTSKE